MNCANFICLRVSGRDSFELASQFDNTPPEPEEQYRPLYKEIRQDENHGPIFSEVKSPMSSGRQMVKQKLPRRLYSDVAAERANQLTTLLNHEAMVRLLDGTRLRSFRVQLHKHEKDTLPEQRTEQEQREREATATAIRKHSKEHYGRDKRFVEAEIRRLFEAQPKTKLPEKKLPDA